MDDDSSRLELVLGELRAGPASVDLGSGTERNRSKDSG
jgi:hypothetical protein